MSSDLLQTVAVLHNELVRMKQIMRPGTQIYPKMSQVSNVNDPEKKGRVKVLYGDQDPIESDWIYTLGFSSGLVPAQFIGTKGITIFIDGNHEDAIFIGSIPSLSGNNLHGSPLSIPIIDTRENVQIPICEAENEGQILLFSDTESVDLKVCIRNNTLSSLDGEDISEQFYWKSITNSLIISKGQYGESNEPDSEVPDTRTTKQWGPCLERLQGETRLFAEDRSLPQGEYMCRKQPGNLWAWVPKSSPPLYTKENLPKCTASIIGSMVAVDDGKNTELVMCGRKDSTKEKDNLVWIKFVRSFMISHEGVTEKGSEIVKNDDAVFAPDSYIQQQDIPPDHNIRRDTLLKIFGAIESAVSRPTPENIINQIVELGIFSGR